MSLNLCIDGIQVYLKITNHKVSNKSNWYSQWCNCDFMFSSGDWLNYHKENDEIFLSSEIEEFESTLTMLISGEISQETEMQFIEPDFVFYIYPQKENQNIISDILLEWRVYFWNDGLTDNYLSITLERDEIIKLRDYFSNIISK